MDTLLYTATALWQTGTASITTTTIVASIALYLGICQVLRFQKLKSMVKKYGFGTTARPSFADMTIQEAHEIQDQVSTSEFPAIFEKGLQFALFRTYGIPSISKLLVQTAQLGTSENVAKRYADTSVLAVEIYSNPPFSERNAEAFARINYLHGHYREQGKISNDDMLYTLSLFMNQPCEWIDRYEWRTLTDLERCAVATFHKSMGDAMNISYEALPSYKTGWKDGLQFYDELDKWSKDYELRNMVPDDNNHKIAVKTKELLLSTIPAFSRPIAASLIAAAMDERLRAAMKFEPASQSVVRSLQSFMSARKFILRHFCLPRWSHAKYHSTKSSTDGRNWVQVWSTTPHYVKPTLWNRFGPSGIYQLLIGAPRPGDKGMCPEGFLRSNVGPRAFDKKGKDEFSQTKSRLMQSRSSGCPFQVL